MQTHKLKTWPEYFDALLNRKKTFELRKNDRGYAVEDILHLCEWSPTDELYTGREMQFHVTYVLDDFNQGIIEGYVAMGLREVKPKEFQVEALGKNARAMMTAGLRAMAGAIESGAEHVSGGGHLYMPKLEGETRNLLRLNMDLTVALPPVDNAPRIQLIN